MTDRVAPPPGYRLVRAGLRDVFAVYRLERASFPLDAYGYLTIANLFLWPGNVNFKAIDAEGRMLGHVTGSPRLLSRRAWIVTLAVAPAHRRRGIGRALLSACEAALSVRFVRLTVRVSNVAAIALYTQAGYRRINLIRGYYRGGEDGLVMEKRRQAAPK